MVDLYKLLITELYRQMFHYSQYNNVYGLTDLNGVINTLLLDPQSDLTGIRESAILFRSRLEQVRDDVYRRMYYRSHFVQVLSQPYYKPVKIKKKSGALTPNKFRHTFQPQSAPRKHVKTTVNGFKKNFR